MVDVRMEYLDLLRDCLLGLVYEDPPRDPWHGIVRDEQGRQVKLGEVGGVLSIEPGHFNLNDRLYGIDWPASAHSMIGFARMSQLREAVETVLEENVPGDFIETGVWRGGACIFMRGILKAHDITDRLVFVADSFEGLPKPTEAGDDGDWHHRIELLAVSENEVRKNFDRYGLLDEQVVFLKGWFKDTLPAAPIERLAILRLDGDLYASTKDALNALYWKVSPGGFVIIDDYKAVAGCKKAIDEFRAEHGIVTPLVDIDQFGAYWRKA